MASERSRQRTGSDDAPAKDGAQTAPEREYESYAEDRGEERSGDESPDVLLDVPVLNIEELNLEVEDLRAHVSARADVADLVKVHVGVDVYLGNVKLEIKGVEAQALLKVKLDRILDTLDRALDAINRNPQILDKSLRSAGQALESAEDTVAQADESVEETVEQATRTGEETSDLADLQIEEEYIDDEGRIIGRAHDEAGNVVEEVLDEEGNVQDQPASEEAAAEPEATDAARRKAERMGIDLSGLEGTGVRGRILVKDVEKAARNR